MTELLTIAEAAKRVRMSVGFLKKAIRLGELPVAKFGRMIRIRPCDLEEYIAQKIVVTPMSRVTPLSPDEKTHLIEKIVGVRR